MTRRRTTPGNSHSRRLERRIEQDADATSASKRVSTVDDLATQVRYLLEMVEWNSEAIR